MFFTCGPQAPTAICNGPACAEYQGDFIVAMMNHMRKTGSQRIKAKAEAEKSWSEKVHRLAYSSLVPETDSVSGHWGLQILVLFTDCFPFSGIWCQCSREEAPAPHLFWWSSKLLCEYEEM
jgi:hypothetical protein